MLDQSRLAVRLFILLLGRLCNRRFDDDFMFTSPTHVHLAFRSLADEVVRVSHTTPRTVALSSVQLHHSPLWYEAPRFSALVFFNGTTFPATDEPLVLTNSCGSDLGSVQAGLLRQSPVSEHDWQRPVY